MKWPRGVSAPRVFSRSHTAFSGEVENLDVVVCAIRSPSGGSDGLGNRNLDCDQCDAVAGRGGVRCTISTLSHAKQVSPQLAKRSRLTFQPVDLFPDRRRQRRGRRIPTELVEHVFEMQFGLGRDFPALPFPVEFGDELSGCCHSSSIGRSAAGIEPTRPPSISWPAGRRSSCWPLS